MTRFTFLIPLVFLLGACEGPLLERYALEGDTLYPEGVAFDPSSRAFLVGSLTEGALTRVAADGAQTHFADALSPAWGTLGLAVDETRGVVWACAGPLDDTGADALWQFELVSGNAREAFDLGEVDPAAQCNDLIVADDGTLYITDPTLARVYRRAPDGTLETFAEGDVFAPDLPGAGPNGLALSPSGDGLYVGTLLPARIVYVPLSDPASASEVELSGDPLASPSGLAGPDGLVFHEDTLVVVLADGVFRLAFEQPTRATVTRLETPGLSGLSTATTAEGDLYVVKSEVVAFLFGTPPDLPFAIERVPGNGTR